MGLQRKLAAIVTTMAVVAIPAMALIIHLPHQQETDYSMLYLALAALSILVMVYNLIAYYPSKHGKLLPRIPPLFMGITLYHLTICATLYFSGGLQSPLYAAALLGPFLAGLSFEAPLAFSNTAMMALLYALVAVSRGGVLSDHAHTLAFNVGGFFLACHLSNRLALELRRQEQSRQEVTTLGEFIRRLEKAKSDFVSIVSHEIRTPLTSIHGFSEILATKEMDPEKRYEFYRIIYNESERLSRLVTNLLNLSRIEAGIELERELVDVPQLVSEDVEFFQSQTERHQLKYLGSKQVPPVYADPDRLHQVVKNLLSNAIKYSPEGGTVEVETGVEGKYLTISVTDHGIGIPREELPRIFERFTRTERQEVLGVSGTGLGLAIVKHLVELHGGKLSVRSEPGQGSTFTVYLPIRGA